MKMPLQNFSDPRVVGAACAAVNEITTTSNSLYKSVLVVISTGTYQVSKLLFTGILSHMHTYRLSMGSNMIC